MALVAAFLVPGSPLPMLRPDNPPWKPLVAGFERAARALAASEPDVIAVYSTQWIAVLDELWQTRAQISGVHVDENWHEHGELPFDIRIDTELAAACIEATSAFGVRSKGVDYDSFPIDSGTIMAQHFLNPGNERPLVICSNNVYHDWQTTEKLGAAVVEKAAALGRKVALVGVGGLSGTQFREEIDIAEDRVADAGDDAWNQRMLALLEAGDGDAIGAAVPDYAQQAKVDMGFKHLAFLAGGLGNWHGAEQLGYGPLYGSAGAIVQFKLG